MKYKILIIVLALVGVFVGCQDDEYEAPNDFSAIGFYTSAGRAPELQIGIFDYLTFSDLSQGTVDHSWTIEEGNFFIKGPIASRDSMEIFETKIINPVETSSKDKTVNVYFKESGLQTVRLVNTFNEYVEFKGIANGEEYIFPSEEVDNKWVIDTTFTVKVFDTIVPKIELRQFGELISQTGTDTIYVEAGDVLEFTDLTTIGEPTNRFWFVRPTPKEGVKQDADDIVASSSDSIASLVFKKLGDFIAGVNVSRSGETIPGDTDRYIIERPIKVIPSSQPFELSGEIHELEDETIQLPFNGEFAPFGGQESFFTVMVNGVNFDIQSVTVNSLDETFLDIKLKDPIYRPDVITVSYNGMGTLESTDTRSPLAFTDAPVIMHDVNMLPLNVASFEDGGNEWGPFTPAWGENQGVIEYTTERAFKGDYSMKLSNENGQRSAVTSFLQDNAISFEAGKTYVMRFSMYLESSNVLPGEISWWRLQEWTQQWVSPNQPVGEWVTHEKEFTSTGTLSQLYFRILPNGSSDYVAYFDDFYINEVETRP